MESCYARYFDPQLGRFLTQDSYLGSIDNPPSLHRYFYANDNPTRYWDPTGHRSDPIQESEAGQALNDALKTGLGFAEGVAERTVEAAPGIALTVARATQNLQRPQDRIQGLDPIGEKDIAEARDTLKFYGRTLSNLDESGPAALDAITELGPERSGRVLGGTTVDVIGTLEGTKALARGGVRALRAAPGEIAEVGDNLSGMFRGRGGPPTAGVLAESATQLPPGARIPDSPPAVDLRVARPRQLAGPTEGFLRYVEAEKRTSDVPMTVAEAEDAYRMNAANADLKVKAGSVPRTHGRHGTAVHVETETSSRQTAQGMSSAGSPVSMSIEEFRFASPPGGGRGPLAPRRAGGSKGLDTVIYANGVPALGLDVKTGRLSTAKEIAALEARFGIRIKQVEAK